MKTLLIASTLVMLSFIGCKDPYGAAAKADADIAQAISSGFVTVTQLRQQNLLSPQEALNVANYLEFANLGDEAFGTCIAAAHTAGSKAGTYTACATAFSAKLASPSELALIKVSNPNSQQTVQGIATAVSAGVASLVTALGGA
jgi:hypothetical protein